MIDTSSVFANFHTTTVHDVDSVVEGSVLLVCIAASISVLALSVEHDWICDESLFIHQALKSHFNGQILFHL